MQLLNYNMHLDVSMHRRELFKMLSMLLLSSTPMIISCSLTRLQRVACTRIHRGAGCQTKTSRPSAISARAKWLASDASVRQAVPTGVHDQTWGPWGPQPCEPAN